MSSRALSATCEKELADFEAALAVFLEFERGGQGGAGSAFGAQVFHGQHFARVFLQRRFGIKGVDMRRPAIGKYVDDVLGFGRRIGSDLGASAEVNDSACAVEEKKSVPPSIRRRLTAPMPMPQRPRNCRRVSARFSMSGL